MWGYGPQGMMGYYGPGWGDGGWMMMIGGIMWLVLLLLGIAAVAWALRNALHVGSAPRPDRRSAGLDILEERYARGEIERDEYLLKKRDLQDRSAKA